MEFSFGCCRFVRCQTRLLQAEGSDVVWCKRGKSPGILSVVLVALTACSGGDGADAGLGLPGDAAASPDASPGSLDAPYRFNLGLLPYAHSGNTALYGLATVDSYACADDVDESGQEIWYRFSTDQDVLARFAVTSSGGVDVDLHLVQVAGGEITCLERGGSTIDVTVEPGGYYLVVDTPVIEGTARPGAYDLLISDSL